MTSVARVCSVEGCEGPVKARGYCVAHHARLMRGWDESRINEPPLIRRPRTANAPRKCDVPDCGRPHRAKGLCGGHYARAKSGRDLDSPLLHQNQQHGLHFGCYYPFCSGKHVGRGLCNRHLKLRSKYNLSRGRVVVHAYSRCEICGDAQSTLNVDHDRACCARAGSCGECVRGFLCGNCNVALGMVRDDASVLHAAIQYLSRNAVD